MKITSVETRLIRINADAWYADAPDLPKGERREWDYPLTTIKTDEGVEGHTMAYGKQTEGRALATMIADYYAPRLVGMNPLYREKIWHEIKHLNRNLRNFTNCILGTFDVALWDIQGKLAGKPIAELLGLYRDRIPTYSTASRFLLTPEKVKEEVQRVKARGFRGYKLQLWQGPEQDIPRLEAAREAAGPGFPLMLDSVSGYDFDDAMEVGRCLDRLHYKWFEEPICEQNITLIKELAKRLDTPILAGEDLDVVELAEQVKAGTFHMVRGDVHHKVGITGLRKLIGMCDLLGVKMEIHTASTPLLDIANLHVACSMRNGDFLESHQDLFRFGLKEPALDPDEDGCVHCPQGPGLGVELDWDWLDNHTVETF